MPGSPESIEIMNSSILLSCLIALPFLIGLSALPVFIYRVAQSELPRVEVTAGRWPKLRAVGWYLLSPVPVIGGISWLMLSSFVFMAYFSVLKIAADDQRVEVNQEVLDAWLTQNQCDVANPMAPIHHRVFKCDPGNSWCVPKHEGGLHWKCESGDIYRWNE